MAGQSNQGLVADELGWTSNDPHLSGSFAPIGSEIEKSDLPVVFGKIPEDLRGAYMRNGPNPQFKPISYTYPLDGDGMIHAVYFDNGRARYKNRFVHTRGLTVERRAGRAVYGGVLSPIPVDQELVGKDGELGMFKNGASINVLRHGDHLLALGEASPGYEMTMELETIGEWKAGTGQPISLGAHNRRHPTTGALFALEYSPDSPTVVFHHFDAHGSLVRSFSVGLTMPSMIHDFVLTQNNIVLLVGPAVFDIEAVMQGKPLLQWRPALGTRIAVIPLDGSQTRWLDAEPFFVFHFANGFERGGDIVVDYVRHDRLSLGYESHSSNGPMLRRMVIDARRKAIGDTSLADFTVEFPRVNDAFDALPTRFIYLPTLSETLTSTEPPLATFNTLLKVDAEAESVLPHDFRSHIIGEPVFIPQPGGSGEDAGYLAVFSYDPANASSQLVLLDAAHIDADPVAVIALPQRVPQGLHGAWIPS